MLLGFTMLLGLKPSICCDPIASLSRAHPLTVATINHLTTLKVYTMELAITGAPADTAVAYLDMSAEHVVNEAPEPVGWTAFTAGDIIGAKIGTTDQCMVLFPALAANPS
jgi:hypothetical protein